MHDQEVPIIQVGIQNRIRKVTAADHFVIPAQCESVVNVYVRDKNMMTSPLRHNI